MQRLFFNINIRILGDVACNVSTRGGHYKLNLFIKIDYFCEKQIILKNEKYFNKYRIPSARATWWDYRNTAPYFITICTKEHQHQLGNIIYDKMIPNVMGIYVQKCWEEIPLHFPFVELINFIVMPNHIHGLLYLHNYNNVPIETLHATSPLIKDVLPDIQKTLQASNEMLPNIEATLPNSMETLHATSLQKNEFMSYISPKVFSLSSIIRSYKSAVTRFANKNNFSFAWQTRYHDHIVRHEEEYQFIYDYITNNPQLWDEDKYKVDLSE